MLERSKNPNASYDEIIKKEIKMVSLIGMKGRIVDTPEFRKEIMENLNRSQDGSRICKATSVNSCIKG